MEDNSTAPEEAANRKSRSLQAVGELTKRVKARSPKALLQRQRKDKPMVAARKEKPTTEESSLLKRVEKQTKSRIPRKGTSGRKGGFGWTKAEV